MLLRPAKRPAWLALLLFFLSHAGICASHEQSQEEEAGKDEDSVPKMTAAEKRAVSRAVTAEFLASAKAHQQQLWVKQQMLAMEAVLKRYSTEEPHGSKDRELTGRLQNLRSLIDKQSGEVTKPAFGIIESKITALQYSMMVGLQVAPTDDKAFSAFSTFKYHKVEIPYDSSTTEASDGIIPLWILYVLVFLLVVGGMVVLAKFAIWLHLKRLKALAAKKLDSADDGVRSGMVDVFRLSASKDRYDYYEAIEKGDNDFNTDIMYSFGTPERFMGTRVVVVLEKVALNFATSMPTKNSPVFAKENALNCLHEAMMSLLDSPLNKAGKLLIYLHSDDGIVIEVHPSCRVPRMFHTFVALLHSLLMNGEVLGLGTSLPLLKIVEGPIEKLLPERSPRFALTPTGTSTKLQDLPTCFTWLSNSNNDKPSRSMSNESTNMIAKPSNARKELGSRVVVFGIGVSEGDAVLEPGFGDNYCQGQFCSIAPWDLEASAVCQMICHEFAIAWNVGRQVNALVEEIELKIVTI